MTKAWKRHGSARSRPGKRFCTTSEGALLFSGGITGARGHAGDNAGRARVLALLNDAKAERRGHRSSAAAFSRSRAKPIREIR